MTLIDSILSALILTGIVGGLVYLGYIVVVEIVREEIKKQGGIP